MEIIFTLTLLLFAEIVIFLLAVLAGGVASLFGASFRAVFLAGLWGLLLPPAGFLYGILIERNVFRVSRTEIQSAQLPESFDGYRAVHISDLHLASFRNRPGQLEEAVAKINALEPDAVFFTGDLVTFSPSELDGLEDILAGIKAKDGVFSVLGNHDYCIYGHWDSDSGRLAAVKELVEREKALGWKLLLNGSFEITRPRTGVPGAADTLSVIGVENTSMSEHFPSYGSLEHAIEGTAGQYRILLSHDPSHWHYSISDDDRINLTLSGHTHAMQFSVFGFTPSRFLYKEYAGLYGGPASGAGETDNYLYVNTGLGETAVPARIGVPPEITLLVLRKV